MDISRARKHLPLFSAIFAFHVPAQLFLGDPGYSPIARRLKYISYPLPEVSTGLTRAT